MRGKKCTSIMLLICLSLSVLPVRAGDGFEAVMPVATDELEENENVWRLNGLLTDVQSPQELNENKSIKVSADIEGNTEGLKYKFVWMKDNWSDWGVLQEFSEESSVTWEPQQVGEYCLYIDVQDKQGAVSSARKEFDIRWPVWTWNSLQIEGGNVQKVDNTLIVSAGTQGNTEGLLYKFVWMKNNWEEWGIISDFSQANQVEFTPHNIGNYQFYCDIRGIDGLITSKNVSCEIVSAIWGCEGLKVKPEGPQPLNTDGIYLSADVYGEVDFLEYKYVWMRDNWAEWGVIQDFSNKREVGWIPEEAGNYTLYCDIRDEDGKVASKTIPYEVTNIEWKNEGIEFFPEQVQKLGETIKVKINISGNTKGMKYKFVWMKNNWEKWGVIQNFSDNSEVEFVPEETGDYKIFVDVQEWDGNVCSYNASYKVMTDIWFYNEIVTSLQSPQEKYTEPITIQAKTDGEVSGLQYKFVWAEAGWKNWGVIQNYSAVSEAQWYPKDIGMYWLYVDVKDADGNVVSKSIPYVISKVYWSFEDVVIMPEEVQKKGENVVIKAEAGGNTKGLKYKYVWMKDNWNQWGIIQDYSANAEVEWIAPQNSGQYKIYVDIKDRDSEIRTKTVDYFIASQLWQHEGVSVNGGKPEQIYTEIPLIANVTGEIDNLQYKYVWMKNDWEEWGVIQNYSKEQEAIWYPKTPGVYTIYSDVKDVDGRVQTKSQSYEVLKAPWELLELKVDGSGSYFVGDKTTVTAVVSGETEGLQYKFVQKNGSDWSDWKVVQDFSTDNSVQVSLNKAGDSTIYVDIMDQRGVVFDTVMIILKGHVFSSAGVSSNRISKGNSVSLYPNISGTAKGLECKYVWMKDNWSSWGVISDFTSSTSVNWTPSEAGQYYIYIDARLNGVVQSKGILVTVVNTKNGWYYENGYKFYYVEDKIVEDVRNIIGWQSSYAIKVNKQMSCVTVYAKDGNNGYIIPVVAFACSPGAGTPVGTFYTQNKYRWHHLYGADGQFCTRIIGHILFHSPPYSSFNNHTLWPKDYNKLGTWASAGCVRLRSGDAKWIYDNCGLGTQVTIYNSSVAGPFSKPVYAKIPLWQTWDPTDPYA